MDSAAAIAFSHPHRSYVHLALKNPVKGQTIVTGHISGEMIYFDVDDYPTTYCVYEREAHHYFRPLTDLEKAVYEDL